jgi:hypothetical protein
MYGFERGLMLERDCLVSFAMSRRPAQIATKSPPKIDGRKALETTMHLKPLIYKGLGRLKLSMETIRNLSP